MKKETEQAAFDPASITQMANAKAQGKRPEYFADPMVEQNFSITMALVAELAVARERIDTLERILVSKGLLDENDIDNYKPDAQTGQARQQAQVEYSARVLRPLQQAVEAMSSNQLNMNEMADQLGDPDLG
ncbi:hypothetical protein [Paraglaciecola sp. 2405UD69-4]|uniref:hypothetical protein n=1 Tax=Paraglaciecola sp. 2405UD69-4 TaxID=3391836 RepID=UPI0039C8E00D